MTRERQASAIGQSNIARAQELVHRTCEIAGSRSLIDDGRANLAWHGVTEALRRHDSAPVFEWLANGFSYQGISDRIAEEYMDRHGRIGWHDIASAIAGPPSCPKLRCYWTFEDCGYRKSLGSCNSPEHLPGCPLPQHDLRKGSLNQTTYSLFLFIRDVAAGDIVGWIDERLAGVDPEPVSDRPARLREALLEPLGEIYGVGSKLLAMTLSTILLSGDAKRPVWIEAGGAMIAIDTLVHNFLHRTGILRDLEAAHPYGPGCYRRSGCAEIIEQISGKIDARQFNPAYPANFPRFVQHAIWQFCAEYGLNRCNGRRIKDRTPCDQADCPVSAAAGG